MYCSSYYCSDTNYCSAVQHNAAPMQYMHECTLSSAVASIQTFTFLLETDTTYYISYLVDCHTIS